jgi:hypothetical protein
MPHPRKLRVIFLQALTFATYAAGFAAINLTWSRLPHRLHRFVPVSGLIVLAAAEAALGFTVRAGWAYRARVRCCWRPGPATAPASGRWCRR